MYFGVCDLNPSWYECGVSSSSRHREHILSTEHLPAPEDGYRIRIRTVATVSEGHRLEAGLWRGRTQVGWVTAETVPAHRCGAQIDALARRAAVRGLMVVTNSGLFPRWRGGGRGRWLYREVLVRAAALGYALGPHDCTVGGVTSSSARRAWSALAGSWPEARAGQVRQRPVLWGGLLKPSLPMLLAAAREAR